MFTEHPRSPHDIPAGHLDDPVASTDEYPTCEGCALVPNTTKQHTVKRIAPFIASQFTNTKMQYSDTKIEMAIKNRGDIWGKGHSPITSSKISKHDGQVSSSCDQGDFRGNPPPRQMSSNQKYTTHCSNTTHGCFFALVICFPCPLQIVD